MDHSDYSYLGIHKRDVVFAPHYDVINDSGNRFNDRGSNFYLAFRIKDLSHA